MHVIYKKDNKGVEVHGDMEINPISLINQLIKVLESEKVSMYDYIDQNGEPDQKARAEPREEDG